MNEIFFPILLVILTIGNYNVHKDFLYPPFIYSVVWFGIIASFILVNQFGFLTIDKISSLSYFIFTTGVLSFSLGGYMKSISRKRKMNRRLEYIKGIQINKVLDNFFLVMPLLFLPLYVMKAFQISNSSGAGNFFMGLRWALNYGEQSYGYLQYFIPIAVYNALYRMLIIIEYPQIYKTYKWKAYLSLFVAVIYTILTTGRTGILFLILSLLGISAIKFKLSAKKILVSLLLFLGLFFSYAIVLNKGGSSENSLSDNFTDVNEIILGYIYGSLPAFDQYINSTYSISYGENIFRFFHVVFNKLDLINNVPASLVQDFVNVPFPTNVYTIYKYYIDDFGIFGSFVILFFIGFFLTKIYFNIQKGLGNKLVFVLFLYPLIFSFFQDQFFSLTSMWLQLLLLNYFTFKYIIKSKPDNVHF